MKIAKRWIEMGEMKEKTGLLQKEYKVGYQFTPSFPITNPVAIISLMDMLKSIQLELERDLEILGATAMYEAFIQKWRDTMEPLLREHYGTCDTIEEVHSPYPEELLSKFEAIRSD